MKILIVTSCTSKKKFNPSNLLNFDDCKDKTILEQRTEELKEYKCKAIDMYKGLQHTNVVEAVNILRDTFKDITVDVNIISAGYGLLKENDIIVPYEVTFNTMKARQFEAWVNYLNINRDVNETIKDYDIIFLLLGGKYLRTLKTLHLNNNQRLIYIKGNKEEGEFFKYPLIGLKGYMLKLLFTYISENGLEVFNDIYMNPKMIQNILKRL